MVDSLRVDGLRIRGKWWAEVTTRLVWCSTMTKSCQYVQQRVRRSDTCSELGAR
jgi:hypothetical protein